VPSFSFELFLYDHILYDHMLCAGECFREALQHCQQLQQQPLHRSMQGGGSTTPYWHSSQGSNLRFNPKENDVDFPQPF